MVAERARRRMEVVVPRVPGHRIEGILGEGGFANVWDAHREPDGAIVALKVAHAATELARSRFVKEADALRVIGPPHVPALYEHGVLDDGRPFLAMQRLDDSTLADILAHRMEPPDVAWVRAVGEAILHSLAAVHENGLVHRDLKPENIFVAEGTPVRACLTDFGIVHHEGRDLADEMSSEYTVIGTAEYISPEQLAGQEDIDARGDIYAFGVLLYELLTLRVPFAGDVATIEKGHRSLRPPPPRDFAAVPSALEALCLDCLAKDPARRPEHAGALRIRLVRACEDAGNAPIATLATTSSPIRLLQDAQQPVLLLAADLPSLDRTASTLVNQRKGFVARQQGLLMLAAFSGLLDEKPEQAALAAARELVNRHGARVVLHFDKLTIRQAGGRRPPKLYGRAVERPDTWMPSARFSGLLVTQAMAEILPEGTTRPAPGHEDFYVPVTGPPLRCESALHGREDIESRVREALDVLVTDVSPGLMTIVGDHGLGKSRLALEIANLARERLAGVRVHLLQATRRSVGRGSETYRRLRDMLSNSDDMGAGVGARKAVDRPRGHSAVVGLGDDLRAAARENPLVVIVDDAHYADDKTLDTIEYATLDGPGIGLWMVVCAHPRLLRRRPHWGERANRHRQATLSPLDEEAAMAMAEELLRPAEFPPRTVLKKLAQWTAGNPQSLDRLVRTLKRRGVVRPRPNSDSWYVATAELEQLPASPVGQWLGARSLESLPLEQAACVRVCSVLGQEFSRDELAWVQNAAERDRTATTTIDTDIGLAALAAHGIIMRVDGDVWAFTQASFQDAIYKLVAERDREIIHRHALAFWRARLERDEDERVLASIARHAGFCGARDVAADANLKLGDSAFQAHNHVEADLYYSAALPFIDGDDHGRGIHGFGRRGSARYRMQRIQEALDDLRQARAHAEALGDRELLLELILEEATALDWASSFAESASRVERAREFMPEPCSVRLKGRFAMAEGRSLYRHARSEEAIEYLQEAVDKSREAGDDETRIIALQLLGLLLAYTNRSARAEERFAEVMDVCMRTGDRLHLCAAYNNRSVLWQETQSFARLRSDLEQTIQLAREIGQPALERAGTHNLAEYLMRSGDWKGALAPARRAYDLRRFLPEPVALDSVLLASVLTLCGLVDEARDKVDEARLLANSGEPSHDDAILIEAIDLALRGENSGTGESWDKLMREGRLRLSVATYLEVVYLRAWTAARSEEWQVVDSMLSEAADHLPECRIWERAFASLADSRPD